jgi:hypothetical protein
MENQDEHRNQAWLRYVIIALLAEKVIQHVAVTAAFYFNWNNIGSTVAMSPAVLMVLGGAVAVLFALGLWAIFKGRAWARKLVIALALFDLIGEFAAQGTIAIDITVSFLIAGALLVLALLHHAKAPRSV